MMKWLLAVLLLFPVATVAQQGNEVLDYIAGWGGIRLEAHQDSIYRLTPAGRAANRRLVRAIGKPDSLLAGQGIGQLEYLFYKRQLHSLVLVTETASASQALLQQLQDTFGAGTQKGRAPQYWWQGQYVRLDFDQNLLTGRATATFLSIPLQKQMEQSWAD